MRDFRVLPIRVCPFSWDSTQNALTHYGNIRITIDLSYPDADGGPILYTSYSSVFQKLYEAQILNFNDYRYLVYGPQSARILIIHGSNSDATFISNMHEFVTWKRQKGFEVSVASTSVAGNSNNAIKSYIQAQYDNPATRPDYLIIVGDVTGNFAVPTFSMPEDEYLGEGDYPYTLLSGNDMLGDIFLGRISAENVSQLVTLFSKIYTYEKTVNLNPSLSSWMNRMLIIGDPRYSGISCVYTGHFVREIATQANPEYEFIENYESGYPSTINSGLNQGVGFFIYRGYYGVSGWSPSGSSLVNGFKLPHAVILTCMTGEFASGTSLSEEFTRMGTSATPSGAVTCVGMASGGTHTAFNNALTSGIMSGILCHGMRTMGEA
ncbi:MAG: C25 family cysteine peptidase, partial [Candidatus Cloacimonadaceae bacterium]|nr:C25 family cysteine peptidase [Candidatus Cloacimonadaceae bacterium]